MPDPVDAKAPDAKVPAWPDAADRRLIGQRISRLDGPAKASGRAKYTYDLLPDKMLWGKMLLCPHAHARIKSIDIAAAQGMPGVKAAMARSRLAERVFKSPSSIVPSVTST